MKKIYCTFCFLLLSFICNNCIADIIIDNTDAASSRVGDWQTSGASGYYKTGSVWARNGATFTWNFTPTQTGQHDVSMWWTQWPSRSTNIPVDIKHASGTARVYINQQTNGGKWNILGRYSFNSGTSYYVKLTAQPDPTSTCADAVKIAFVSSGGGGGGGGGSTTTENIYIALPYNTDNPTSQFTSMLRSLGATQQGDVWIYNRSGKTYRIQWANSNSALRAALATSGAHIIVEAHSNYGLGLVFATNAEIANQTIYGVYYIDDPRIFQMTSKWVALDVKDFIKAQAYPYWWPEFRDGSSGIMPYTFSQGTPPHNYYLTYRIPGSSTYYKMETARRSAIQRFPDSGRTPWYASDGSNPIPGNSSHTKYFITNSGSVSGGYYYPKPHYAAKTIIRTKANTLQPAELKYSRIMFNSCGSAHQYAEPFGHGIMFYAHGSVGNNSVVYLRNYLQGKSDYDIWRALQSIEPTYDYYDFSKAPASQLQSMAAASAASAPIDADMAERISSLNDLPVSQVLDELEDSNYIADDHLMTDAIAESLGNKEEQAVAQALDRIKKFKFKRTGPNAARKNRDFYVSRKVLNFFADISADKLVALYNNKDPFIRGKAVNAAGELSDFKSIRNMLTKALNDKSACQESTPEIIGLPLRVCDAAYNQLVLHLEIENMLRTIGTGHAIEDRDYHIDLLKEKIK